MNTCELVRRKEKREESRGRGGARFGPRWREGSVRAAKVSLVAVKLHNTKGLRCMKVIASGCG